MLQHDRLDERASALGERFRAGLHALQERHEAVGDVRGRGLLQGVELVKDRTTKEPSYELVGAVTARCLELGLHVNIVQAKGAGGTLRLAPPLTSTEEEIDLGLSILDQALSEHEHGPRSATASTSPSWTGSPTRSRA